MKESVEALTPGVLGLLALFAIGGLIFIGWQANLVGLATTSYAACCTTNTWYDSPTGISQGNAVTTTESCFSTETPSTCCARAATIRAGLPVSVLGSKTGSCTAPETGYPATFGGYPVCCTLETWQNSPIGYTQGVAQTTTEFCGELETPSQCCLRTGSARYQLPVKLIGFRDGNCQPTYPQRSYPIRVI